MEGGTRRDDGDGAPQQLGERLPRLPPPARDTAQPRAEDYSQEGAKALTQVRNYFGGFMLRPVHIYCCYFFYLDYNLRLNWPKLEIP